LPCFIDPSPADALIGSPIRLYGCVAGQEGDVQVQGANRDAALITLG
jgi:hypothetical protein